MHRSNVDWSSASFFFLIDCDLQQLALLVPRARTQLENEVLQTMDQLYGTVCRASTTQEEY